MREIKLRLTQFIKSTKHIDPRITNDFQSSLLINPVIHRPTVSVTGRDSPKPLNSVYKSEWQLSWMAAQLDRSVRQLYSLYVALSGDQALLCGVDYEVCHSAASSSWAMCKVHSPVSQTETIQKLYYAGADICCIMKMYMLCPGDC